MEGQRGRSFERVKMKCLLEVCGESVTTPDGKAERRRDGVMYLLGQWVCN